MSGDNKLSSYPNGFKGGVSIDGSAPLHREHAGKVFYVGDTNTPAFPNRKGASDANRGSFLDPLGSITKADELAVEGRGDVVKVLPGTTIDIETAISIETNGLIIQGLGVGDERPTITCNVADALDIEADNVLFENILFGEPDGAVASRIDVVGTGFGMVGCHVDIADEDVDVITLTATAHDATFVGLTVDAEGASEAFIDVEGTSSRLRVLDSYFYGGTAPSSGWIDAEGNACTDTLLDGIDYNGGTLFGQTAAVRTVDNTVPGGHMQVAAINSELTGTGDESYTFVIDGNVDIHGVMVVMAAGADTGDDITVAIETGETLIASTEIAAADTAGDVIFAASPGATATVDEVGTAESYLWAYPVAVRGAPDSETNIDITATGSGEGDATIHVFWKPADGAATSEIDLS